MAAKSVSILGCGYLGLPVGRELVRRGWRVKGSTTTQEKISVLREAGIEPFLLRLDPSLKGEGVDDFFRSHALFLNIPPGRRRSNAGVFLAGVVANVQEELRKTGAGFVVMASSTSVYANANGWVEETDAGEPPTETGRALLEAEASLRAGAAWDTTVLRFAGLYGYARAPGRFFAGGAVHNPAAPVNLAHRDDAVAVTVQVLEQDVRGEVFNVCADGHPHRDAFYAEAAAWLSLPPPRKAPGGRSAGKRVSNYKLKERLCYVFLHPDPLVRAP